MIVINSEEADLLIELVLTLLFMTFGIFSMNSMINIMNERTVLNDRLDKIEMSYTRHQSQDPFYFTGYEAYMFAWHMEGTSNTSLSYVGGDLSTGYDEVDDPKNIISKQRLDNASDTFCITLSNVDDNGQRIPQFLVWRNQQITGNGLASGKRNVRSTINSLIDNSTNQNKIKALYRGTLTDDTNVVNWHLELTDRYSMNNDLGYDANKGGKTFKWVLAPTYR